MSFSGLKDLGLTQLQQSGYDNRFFDLKSSAQKWLSTVSSILQIVEEEIVEGELAAYISYAIAFPSNFLALVDTYNVLR